MNWTEGNLNRHSRARKGKETVLRQKEHFAKVRAGLLDANVKISPPSVSALAVPARPPSSVSRGALKSTPSRKHQSDDRLISSRYFCGTHPKLPTPTRVPEKDVEETMRQKSRKLLFKGDWVGTNVQKPIEMKFTKPRGSPGNPWGAKKAHRQASKRKIRRLIGLAHDERHNKPRLSAVNTFTPPSLRQIKVRVGTYERALGDTSNASSRSKGLQAGSSNSFDQPMYCHQRDHFQDGGRVNSDSSHRSHSSASQTPLLTTSPLLFHPVPTRPALLQLLHRQSADSDNADSTFAQVGVELPAVPPSQAAENDVWINFVACPGEISSSNEMGTPDDLKEAARRLVSPGISQFGTSRQLHHTSKAAATVPPVIGGVEGIGEDKTSTTPPILRAEEVRPEQSSQRSSDTCYSDVDQVTPNAGDSSSSGLRCDLPQPSESPRSNDRPDQDLIEDQNMTAGSSDQVSLLVMSSSPKLLSPVDMVDEVATFEMNQPGDIGFNLLTPRVTVHQLEQENSPSRDGSSAAVQIQLPSECKQEDENDMWRNFVFEESSENLEKVLEEARKETARSLRPSLPSPSTYHCEESQKGLIPSSLGSESIDRRDFAEEFCNTTRDVFTTASASHVATAGTSSEGLSSEATSESIDIAVRTDRATHGSSGSSSANGSNTGQLLFLNDLVTPSTCEADTSPSTDNPEQLEKHGEADDRFKFARPKLFVGKKIGQVDEQERIALSAPQIRGTTQTRRRQRRATDGRANIRRLPNYGSDPIEEFEGDVRSDRAEKGSMFGPLETENGV